MQNIPQNTPPLPASVAEALKQAEALTKASKFAEAIALLEQRTKELGEKITEDEKRVLLVTLADAHFAWGNEAEKRSAWKEVIAHYQAAYEIDKTYRKNRAAADLNNIGAVYSDLGENAKALEFYNMALPMRRAVGDKRGEAATLTNIGGVYNSLGEKAKALEFYNMALPMRRAVGDKRGEAVTLSSIGFVYSDLGENAKALEFYNLALQIRRAFGDKAGEANTLDNIGVVYDSLGENAKALEFYNQALQIRRALGDKGGEAATLTNIGGVYNSLGEKAKALEFYNQALPTLRAFGDKGDEAATLTNIGLVYNSLGEKAKALEFYNQALPIHQQVGNRPFEANTLTNIGAVYSDLGENAKALDFYNQALPLYRQVGDKRGEAATLDNIGVVYDSLGEKAKALEFYNQALPLWRAVGDKQGETNTLTNIGLVYSSLGENVLSTALFKSSITLLQQLRGATPTTDRQSQQTFLKENENKYSSLIQGLNRQGRTAEAQQAYLLTKRQEVKTKGTLLTPDLTPLESSLIQRYNQKADKIGQIANQLTPLALLKAPTQEQQVQIKDLNTQLQKASDDFLAFLEQARKEAKNAPPQKVEKPKLIVELHQALATLQAQTKLKNATVFTIVTSDAIEFMVIKDGKTTLRKQSIKQSDLNQLIGQFKMALTATNGQGTPSYDPKPLAQKLYNLLVKPIAADIAGCQQVFWMLDGKLRYVPLAALHNAKQYLIQGTQQHTLLSAEAITTLTRKPQAARRTLAMATSKAHNTEGVAFAALPGVPQELDVIKPTKRFQDAAFTKDILLSQLKKGYSIVHLATHFALRPGDLYTSFLLLGDGKALRLAEINDLPDDLFAGVDLLTLSACDTGSGATSSNGAELEGLSLVAQRKGAAAVLSTLWPVNDASTAALMGRFYTNMGKASKAEALRQAQLALLTGTLKPANGVRGPVAATGAKKSELSLKPFALDPRAPYAHPFYWAPFTLSGNTR